jgi:hypothetical protein
VEVGQAGIEAWRAKRTRYLTQLSSTSKQEKEKEQ